MTITELRKAYLDFFKAQGHAVIPSASLVPENDPTTLFTGSGMQPLVPYLLGKDHPEGVRLTNSQKSLRSMDIEEVGDNRHTTFFEMLGNWSLGDYFKKEQLPWSFTFLTDSVGLDPKRLYVTVFSGDAAAGVPQDDEAVSAWKQLFSKKGIVASDVALLTEEEGGKRGMQGGRIFYYAAKKNWWSRAGVPEKMPAGEPGGPDSEVFFDFYPELGDRCLVPGYGDFCHPNCDCGRFMEIGNSVFMEYVKLPDGSFGKLPKSNVDFGGGLERIAAAENNNPDVFLIDAFTEARETLEKATGHAYAESAEMMRAFRIVLDHIRAAAFLIADGVLPSNTERGYILRRLIRRAVYLGADKLGVTEGDAGASTLGTVAAQFASKYAANYPEGHGLGAHTEVIVETIQTEEKKFKQTLSKGLKEFEKAAHSGTISADTGFLLFTTYGFPFEVTQELAKERGLSVDADGFYAKLEEHRKLSRAGSEQRFKGGLADTSVETTKLHTAHHLLLRALQIVLGDQVKQRGSNITAERLRIDFLHSEKMTPEQLAAVEQIVNEKIAEALPMTHVEMPKEEAEALGAEHEFGQKYPERVSVYYVGNSLDTRFSIEFCGGPHVSNTSELGEGGKRFKIQKEEAVAAGIRRIRAVLA